MFSSLPCWPARHLLVWSWRCSLRQWYISQGAFSADCHRKCCRRRGNIPTPGSQQASDTFQKHIFQSPLCCQTTVAVQHTLQLLLSSNKWNLRFCFIGFSTCVYTPPWRDLESNMILIPDVGWGSRCCFTPLKRQYFSRLSAVRESKKCNYPFSCYSTVK